MKLYVVPTPIGNLEDMTFRAIKVLKEVDFILAEDTRTSSVLLKHFEIDNKLWAHHKFNEHQSVASVIEHLKAGQTGAVISDVSIKGLTKQSEMQIKKELSLTAKEYDGIYFAKSDDVMDVREILIIKLKENQSAEDAIKKIEKRVSAKQTLFEGYAPEQSAMLKNYVLRQKAGFIFYCVLKESETAVSAFNKTL